MKISAQEEYGLRILLRIARAGEQDNMSIPVLSNLEGLSQAYVGKITGILRKCGFINSNPGNVGGYILARPAHEININKVLKALGGSLFDAGFCGEFTGANRLCTNSVDCSARSLWQMVQATVDHLLDQVSLYDLTASEEEASGLLRSIVERV